MKKIVTHLIFLAMLSACSMSKAKSFEECEVFLSGIIDNIALSTPLQKAQYLEAHGKDCLQYEEFNDWLGFTYQDAGKYDKSVEIAKKALPNAKNYKPNFLQMIAEAELQTGSEAEAYKQAVSISTSYPNFTPIQYFLYGIEIKRENWAESLIYAENSYHIEKNALSLLGMAAALHQLGRHEDAVNAVFKALTLEPERIAKTTGVLEGIYSLAILGRKPEAAELCRRHIAANPNWRENDAFVQAAKELGAAN